MLRRLRQQPVTAAIPVAFLTSLGAREDRSLGLHLAWLAPVAARRSGGLAGESPCARDWSHHAY